MTNKIGIITFHNSYNCGSMLQCLALQTVLEKWFNASPEVIDFSNEGQKAMYRPFWPVTGPKSILKNVLWATVYSRVKEQARVYEAFEHKYFYLSKDEYSSCDELHATNNLYSKFITGSDQVWNIRCMDADDAYFLSFVDDPAKKNAYAVSFGANNPFDDASTGNHYKRLVSDFSNISVRENNAKKWTEEAINRDVSLCLDPTMLLNESEWAETVNFDNGPLIQGAYAFYYCFSISQEASSFLGKVSKITGMPVYFFDPKEWALRRCWKNGIKLVNHFGPESFLNYMKYARIVFTTSFHGTAFSTIFHKDFWYIDSGHNDLSKDDRAVSFLTQLKLMDRYKTIEYLLDTDLLSSPDYRESDVELQLLKNVAFSYLEPVVND